MYFGLAKYCTTELGVGVWDLCFIRTFTLFLISVLTTAMGRRNPLEIEKKDRLYVLGRSFCGAVGYAALIFSVGNVSLMASTSII